MATGRRRLGTDHSFNTPLLPASLRPKNMKLYTNPTNHPDRHRQVPRDRQNPDTPPIGGHRQAPHWLSPTSPSWTVKTPTRPPLAVIDKSILDCHRQAILTVTFQQALWPNRHSGPYSTYLVCSPSRRFLFIVFAILAGLIKPQKPCGKKGKECQLIYATVRRLRCHDNVRYPHSEVPCRGCFPLPW